MIKVAVLATVLLSGCASDPRISAHQAVTADLATTAYGISTGIAVEANPLLPSPAAIVAGGILRYAVIEHLNTKPEPERTKGLSATSSITWGIAASNLAVIATGLNPIGLIVGAATAYGVWRSTEDKRLFAETCATAKSIDPKTECIYDLRKL
jgi:hypothetical protein